MLASCEFSLNLTFIIHRPVVYNLPKDALQCYYNNMVIVMQSRPSTTNPLTWSIVEASYNGLKKAKASVCGS